MSIPTITFSREADEDSIAFVVNKGLIGCAVTVRRLPGFNRGDIIGKVVGATRDLILVQPLDILGAPVECLWETVKTIEYT